MLPIIICGIFILLLGSIFLLADDSREFLFNKVSYPEEKKILKSRAFWKLTIQLTIVLVIYNVGALAGRIHYGVSLGVLNFEDRLWNPYIFGGMPSYAAGGRSLDYWNQINIFVDATMTLLLTNPLGLLLFILSATWMMKRLLKEKKWIWANYILVIVMELLMIFTARWSV